MGTAVSLSSMILTAPRLDRARGLLAGLFLSRDRPAPGECALARVLLGALDTPEIDLARIVAGWVALNPGPGLTPAVASGLDWLREHGSPPLPHHEPAGLGAALVVLPLVLRTRFSQANLVSAAYHTAGLVTGSQPGAWAAVAATVTAACFLQDRRDFLGDVLEALKANDAPAALVDGVRQIPFRLPGREGSWDGSGDETLELLWASHHLPTAARVAQHLGPLGHVAMTVGIALAGAREGIGPDQSLDADLERMLAVLTQERV